MINVTPRKYKINRVYVSSEGLFDNDKERVFFLGVFTRNVTEEDIRNSLTEFGLWSMVLTPNFFAQGKSTISMIPGFITEGPIFENAIEFAINLKGGTTYQDICRGSDYVEI